MTEYKPLQRALDAATRPYNTYPDASHFSSIKEQYVAKYGEKKWTASLVKEVFGTSSADKNAFAKGTEEYRKADLQYKANLKSIQRYGKGERNPERAPVAVREKLSEIGQKLNPVKRDAPPSGLTITIAGSQGSGRHQRDREFTAHMDHQLAQQFVQAPTLEDFFKEIYPDWTDAVDVLFGAEGGDSGNLDDVSVSVA